MKARYWDAPDLSNVGKNGYRFVNAVSDFATHADPIRKTRNYYLLFWVEKHTDLAYNKNRVINLE